MTDLHIHGNFGKLPSNTRLNLVYFRTDIRGDDLGANFKIISGNSLRNPMLWPLMRTS